MTDNSRYARQLNLLGNEGQEALANSKVLCIGAGGLGSIVTSYLVAAGIGVVSIVDPDTIELSNLTRQITYNEDNCSQSKVKTLSHFLRKLNSSCTLNAYDFLLTPSNAPALINAHDVIVDCSDNFPTRYLISDSCSAAAKPLISASVNGFNGQIMVLLQELCYRCLFHHPRNAHDGCADVIGPAVGIIASIQANEVVKFITNLTTTSYILQVDALNNQQTSFAIMPDPACINNHDDVVLNYETTLLQKLAWNEVLRLYHENKVQIIDIRTPSATIINPLMIASRHLEAAKINQLTQFIAKDQALVVICNHGFRSKLAASRLALLGYTRVYYASINHL